MNFDWTFKTLILSFSVLLPIWILKHHVANQLIICKMQITHYITRSNWKHQIILFRVFKCNTSENYVLFCVIFSWCHSCFSNAVQSWNSTFPEVASIMVLSQVVASGHNWATAQWDAILLNYEVRDVHYYLVSDWRRSKFY